MSEFLLEKEQEKWHASVSDPAKAMKEWHFISQSMTQPAEVTCMVVVTSRITLL